jgi:hypothetical protein
MNATPSTAPNVTSRRRWFQYSLRTLLIIVLLASVGMSYIAVTIQHQRSEYIAARAINDAESGRVMFTPTWLGGVLHDGSLVTVYDVELFRGSVDDATWARVRSFSGLQQLRLDDTKITDASLRNLEGLKHLQGLWLGGTGVTDAGILHLRGLSKLRDLDLNSTRVTDTGLAALRGLSELRNLSLVGTRITDDGLVNLEGLTDLRSLALVETKITDAGLAHLRGL